MSGEQNLATLFATMAAEQKPGVFVFCTLPDDELPAGIKPVCVFQEAEGLTLIVEKSEAEKHGIAFQYESSMITLNVHSSLEAVGFLAGITGELAKVGISVNPVSAYYHDHLFVPVDRAEDTLTVLGRISRNARHAG